MKKLTTLAAILILIVSNVTAQTQPSNEVKLEMINLAPTYVEAFVAAANEVAEIKATFSLVSSGATTKQLALKLYNEKFGTAFGTAKTYEEAVKLLDKKAYIYMHIKGLKAFSAALMEKSKEVRNQ